MILVKLGGSVITDKQGREEPRRAAIDGIARALGRLDEPVIAVHGGGSYGHYWSVRYDMHTRGERYDPRGVARVKRSMAGLNGIVLDSMIKAGLSPYGVPPAALMSGPRPVPRRVRELGEVAASGMIPVTFGDALWHGGGRTYILSGDRIMSHLARTLRPRLSVFALAEDGLYEDMESRRLITEMAGQRPAMAAAGADVTGGMARKVEEASRIARSGLDAVLLNGNRPERIVKAVKRKGFRGTLFRGRRVG